MVPNHLVNGHTSAEGFREPLRDKADRNTMEGIMLELNIEAMFREPLRDKADRNELSGLLVTKSQDGVPRTPPRQSG